MPKPIRYFVEEAHGSASGTQVRLYLIPSDENTDDAIEVHTFSDIGPGCPAPAYHGRWYCLASLSTDFVGESLVSYLQGHESVLRRLDAHYLGSEWDGSNLRGRWDDYASDPEYDLTGSINCEVEHYWDAGEYLAEARLEDMVGDHQTVQEIVDALIAEAAGVARLDPDELRDVVVSRIEEALEDLDAPEYEDDPELEARLRKLLEVNRAP